MPGHTLVVPRDEVDHWIDLDPALAAHLFSVAQQIGRAQDLEWKPRRVGVLIVGEEVPHTHLHVVPINHPEELSFAHADPAPDFDALDDAAVRIRARLRELGRAERLRLTPDEPPRRRCGSTDRSRRRCGSSTPIGSAGSTRPRRSVRSSRCAWARSRCGWSPIPSSRATCSSPTASSWTRPPATLVPIRVGVGENLFTQSDKAWAKLQPARRARVSQEGARIAARRDRRADRRRRRRAPARHDDRPRAGDGTDRTAAGRVGAPRRGARRPAAPRRSRIINARSCAGSACGSGSSTASSRSRSARGRGR